jgi:small-conductance mechanosensitive channel
MSINKNFKQNGIEIPFPQTDIHLRTMPENSGTLDD